jgi:hypothetical protein
MDIIDHYQKLIYFAFLAMREELCHRDQLMAYYAHVVMDDVRGNVYVPFYKGQRKANKTPLQRTFAFGALSHEYGLNVQGEAECLQKREL